MPAAVWSMVVSMPTPNFNPCILIPVYNHDRALEKLLPQLVEQQSAPDVILINDGSEAGCRQTLENLVQQYSSVSLINLDVNGGKGAAVKAGFQVAFSREYSHALQMDADGQHNPEDLQQFLKLGQQYPQAIICGIPIYNDSVPRLRYYARYLTHIWVWINTLSLTIKDSMCGFRLYPLPKIIDLIETESTGDRMEFDAEILVRWTWQRGEIINLPTAVNYPEDGISHFATFRDNVLISTMHAKLFFGMLWRLPRLLLNKKTHPAHPEGKQV